MSNKYIRTEKSKGGGMNCQTKEVPEPDLTKYENMTAEEIYQLKREHDRLEMENKILRSELDRKNATINNIMNVLAEDNLVLGAYITVAKESMMAWYQENHKCGCKDCKK